MAKNDCTGIVRVNEGEVKGYLDKLVREAVVAVFENIMSEEAEEMICASRYERTEQRCFSYTRIPEKKQTNSLK